MPRYRVSSTSDLISGIIFKGKKISKIYKSGDTRVVHYTDGSKEKLSKEEIKALARIAGGMKGAQQSTALTAEERKKRIERSLKMKESWLERDKKGFIASRDLVDRLAAQVEGTPEIKYVRRRGVKIPMIGEYYSKSEPSADALMDRAKKELGLAWAIKLRLKLRKKKNPADAWAELVEEYKAKKGGSK